MKNTDIHFYYGETISMVSCLLYGKKISLLDHILYVVDSAAAVGVPLIFPDLDENFNPSGSFGDILHERWSCGLIPF